MPSLFDYEKFQAHLFELESALSLTAMRDCQSLHADSQLSAAIYALLRATSLFRATLSLLQSDIMDANDVMRRAFWEAWMLGYEFRLESSARHARLWHEEKHKHGNPDISLVKSYENAHGITTSTYGVAYGGLSEVSHPTKSAAENSFVTVTALHGNPDSKVHLPSFGYPVCQGSRYPQTQAVEAVQQLAHETASGHPAQSDQQIPRSIFRLQ